MSDKPKRQRVPFSANRKRLQVDKGFPGFCTRWFNDQDGRIDRALDAGWEFVKKSELGQATVGERDVANGNTDVNSNVSRIVGRTRDNQAIRAIFMKLRNELRKEDDEAKERMNALVDEAIRAGKAGGADVKNQYGEVKLTA
jgi:hypothetical protein